MQHGSDSAPTRGRPLGKKKFVFPSPLRLPFCSFPAAHLLCGWDSSRSSWLSFRKGQRRAYNPYGSSRGARRLYWSPQQCSAGRYEGGGRQGRRAGAETGVRCASSSKPASERESERAGKQHLLSRRAGISPTLARRPPRCPSRKLRILPRAARLSSAASSLFALSCGRRRRHCRCRPSTCVPPPQGGVTCRGKKNWKGRKRWTYVCV